MKSDMAMSALLGTAYWIIYRVWLKSGDKPGLAMSRSIGDHIGRPIGVICDPDIYTMQIKQRLSALVIGSDGLFDWVNQDEIGDILWKERGKSAEVIANNLVQIAIERWKEKEDIIDDCTCIIVYIKLT